MNETAKILHNALDYMRKYGWTKNVLKHPDTGKVCARGALMYSKTAQEVYNVLSWNPAWDLKADQLLCKVAEEQFPDRVSFHSHIVAVNNHPETTFEDIEMIFEKAIIKSYEEVEI